MSNELFSAHYLFHMFESRYLENIRCYSNSNRSMLSFSNRIKYSTRQKNEFHSSFAQSTREKLISQLLLLTVPEKRKRKKKGKKKKRKKGKIRKMNRNRKIYFLDDFELLIDDIATDRCYFQHRLWILDFIYFRSIFRRSIDK